MENEIHNLIPLEEVKHFLRVTDNLDDKLIKTLLEGALFHLERYISQTLIQKTYSQEISASEDQSQVILSHSPIVEVVSVKSEDGREINYYSNENTLVLLEKSIVPITVQYTAALFKAFLPNIFKVALLEIASYLYNSGSTKATLSSILGSFSSLKQYRL